MADTTDGVSRLKLACDSTTAGIFALVPVFLRLLFDGFRSMGALGFRFRAARALSDRSGLSCDIYICNNGTSHSITSPSGSPPRRSRRYGHDRRRPKEETPEESETEEGSRETALRRSNARAVRQHEPSRHIARNAPQLHDLSVQELKRLLGEKTEEKRSATNELSPFSKPDTDVQGGAKWRIIAKGGDIATEKFQIPRTDIAAKRLLFPTWPEEFCELSRFERRASHNYLFKNFKLQHNNLLENFIHEKKQNRRAYFVFEFEFEFMFRRYEHDRRRPREETPEESETEEGSRRPHCDVPMRARCDNTSPQGTLQGLGDPDRLCKLWMNGGDEPNTDNYVSLHIFGDQYDVGKLRSGTINKLVDLLVLCPESSLPSATAVEVAFMHLPQTSTSSYVVLQRIAALVFAYRFGSQTSFAFMKRRLFTRHIQRRAGLNLPFHSQLSSASVPHGASFSPLPHFSKLLSTASTADEDQVILKGIFKFCDIKSSAPLLKCLAKEISGDCTPKAVSHRLANIRNHGKPLPASTGNTPVKAIMTPKTPRSCAKATPKKSRTPGESESDSGSPEGPLKSPSPSVKRTSAKRQRSASKVVYAETDGSDVTEEEYIPYGGTKKIKREYAEDEGEVGFTTAEEV
ncbi:hypothetical protein HBI83_245580 [Parastagonospora nodorum]|nr:hypothetical protein HBI83_245580 [Parastagonospora nodorum]